MEIICTWKRRRRGTVKYEAGETATHHESGAWILNFVVTEWLYAYDEMNKKTMMRCPSDLNYIPPGRAKHASVLHFTNYETSLFPANEHIYAQSQPLAYGFIVTPTIRIRSGTPD